MIKNSQANAILECVHQVLVHMVYSAELALAESVTSNAVDLFLNNLAWAICSTYHTVLKNSPGAAMFGSGMLFDIPFEANRNRMGDYRQN
jgi:hypothetical protein